LEVTDTLEFLRVSVSPWWIYAWLARILGRHRSGGCGNPRCACPDSLIGTPDAHTTSTIACQSRQSCPTCFAFTSISNVTGANARPVPPARRAGQCRAARSAQNPHQCSLVCDSECENMHFRSPVNSTDYQAAPPPTAGTAFHTQSTIPQTPFPTAPPRRHMGYTLASGWHSNTSNSGAASGRTGPVCQTRVRQQDRRTLPQSAAKPKFVAFASRRSPGCRSDRFRRNCGRRKAAATPHHTEITCYPR